MKVIVTMKKVKKNRRKTTKIRQQIQTNKLSNQVQMSNHQINQVMMMIQIMELTQEINQIQMIKLFQKTMDQNLINKIQVIQRVNHHQHPIINLNHAIQIPVRKLIHLRNRMRMM